MRLGWLLRAVSCFFPFNFLIFLIFLRDNKIYCMLFVNRLFVAVLLWFVGRRVYC